MSLAHSLQLRLPSLRRLVPPRPSRRACLQPLRCSTQPEAEGEDSTSDDSSANMLRRFSTNATPPTGAPSSSSSGNSSPSAASSSSSSSSTRGKGFGKLPGKQGKPASATDAVINALSGVSEGQGRVPRGTNIVVGSDNSEDTWRELDGQVNEYPGQRTFKAIGSGGQEFVDAMVACAEKVVGPLHEECVSQRASAKGNYTSVTLSVWVESPDQVVSIYGLMKEDSRLKFFF